MQSLIDRLLTLPSWQIVLITTLTLWEGAFITVFPEEVVMCVLGILWSQDRIALPFAWLAMVAGLLPSNLFTVFVGRKFGMRILRRAPFRWFMDPDLVETAMESIRRRGAWIVAITRFTPVIRGPVYFAVGTSGFEPLRFIRTDVLAGLIQIPLWLVIGRIMGSKAESLVQAFQWVGILFGSLVLGSVLMKLIVDTIKSKKSRRAGRSKAQKQSSSG